VIKAFPELFKSKLPEKLPEEAEKLLSMLDSSVSRLNSRVDQMAQITSVQTGGYAFDTESVELNKSIQDKIQEHLEGALSNENTLSFGSDETYERYGIIDTRAFGEILDELIENAIESTKKGTLTISIEPNDSIDSIHQEDNSHTHNYWVISVSDTGKGISPEIKELLFTPFIQQGGTLYRDESKGGLGLGLYFVSLLVEKMGGKIWFTSELGMGTTFYFTVPSSETT
ncbi:HAMP domain-containing histidine kinase, partial [candidate division WWE3 bacterium]|nr:HAMP domain-containing histidine kinase [candidate division WWE3 bacterium]